MTIRIEEFGIDTFVNHGNAVLNGTRVKALLPMRRAESAVDTLKGYQLRHVTQAQALAGFNIRPVARCETDIGTIGAVEKLAIAKCGD